MAIEFPTSSRKRQMGYPAGLLGADATSPPFTLGETTARTSPTPVSAPTINLQAQVDLYKAQKKLVDAQYQQAQEQLATAKQVVPYAGGISAGLGAGSQVTPTTRTDTAALQTVSSGLSGAASGALAGSIAGPQGAAIGAVAGGLVGLVSGGIQSYIGLKESRKQRRELDAQNREVRRLNEQARQDYLRETAFNQNLLTRQQGFNEQQKLLINRQNAIQQRWGVLDQSRQLLNNLVAGNQQLKNVFIQQAR